MFKLGLSSQILQRTWRYTGKPVCVTSSGHILEFPMRCHAVRIKQRGKSPARDPREWERYMDLKKVR